MSKKKIVVKGGHVYEVSESSGTIYVRRKGSTVGKVKTMEDALALIKNHSGKEIESIG